jgi:glutamyl-tRNA reductase
MKEGHGMIFCITGVSFKTAPIEIREVLSFHKDMMEKVYLLLLAKEEVQEAVILSTCNRVEIYAIVEDGYTNLLKDFIRDYHKYSMELEGIYQKTGADAVRHLCVVASGLDSMVLGEPQIFGQVKDAYAEARKCGAVKHAFDYLFTQVFSIVKKVRTKTRIGERNVSVSYAVVKLASDIYKQIDNRRVMILGAGEMGELTVRNLLDAGVKDVVVANRTFQRAVALAERFNGTPIMIHEIAEYIAGVDIIISSIAVSEYLITREHLQHIKDGKRSEPVFVVDISVPRSVDPQIAQIENVHLYNIDDLRAVVDSNSETRRKEAEKGLEIIESKVKGIVEYLRSCDIVPTIISIRTKAEEIRKDSILKTADELQFTDAEKATIDSMTKSIVNKIMYHSEVKLREYSSAINLHKKDHE